MVKHSKAQIHNARVASKTAYLPINKIKQKDIPGGYTLDLKNSGRRTKVFKNDTAKHVLVAHRGTKTFRDVLDDVSAVMLGRRKQNKRFQQASRVVKDVQKQNPGYSVTSTGHSLGGTLAQETPAKDVITFNKGAFLPDLLKRRNAYQTDVRKRGDIISVMSNFQHGPGRQVHLPGSYHPFKAHEI